MAQIVCDMIEEIIGSTKRIKHKNGVGVQTAKELRSTCLGCEDLIKTREGFRLWEKMVTPPHTQFQTTPGDSVAVPRLLSLALPWLWGRKWSGSPYITYTLPKMQKCVFRAYHFENYIHFSPCSLESCKVILDAIVILDPWSLKSD